MTTVTDAVSTTTSIPPRSAICEEGRFSCGGEDGVCIPESWRCDHDTDCLSGLDEENCIVTQS